MKKKTAKIDMRKLPTTYAELIHLYPPRPIHDDVDLENATEYVDAMAGHDLNQDQQDYLDLLSTLIAEYEDHQVECADLSPIDALKALLDENGMSASDLGRLLGNRELGSKILRGERRLSLSHIQRLAARFAVSPALFISKG